MGLTGGLLAVMEFQAMVVRAAVFAPAGAAFAWLSVCPRATFEDSPGVPAWWVPLVLVVAARMLALALGVGSVEVVGALFLAAVAP